jgi:carboxyl-terminal processing protease
VALEALTTPMTHIRLQPRPTTLVAVVTSIVAGILTGAAAHHHKERRAAPAPTDLSTFTTLLKEIRTNYVDPRDEATLVNDAIAGMMQGLDAHSSFLDRAALSDLSEQTEGRFGGIGIELAAEGGRVRVLAPLDDSPAARAGIAAGDEIIAIDGVPLGAGGTTDVVGRLRGEPGTPVQLTLARGTARFDVELVRAIVTVTSVRARYLEPGYGYVRISQFQNRTGAELEAAVKKLKAEHGRLDGLVLDLRNNPGGVLQASVDVVDAFLSEGLIVYTKGRQPSAELRFTATGGDLLDGAPLVVLINRGSASASEIVAGALQDHKRARVLGGTSYGKGSVQAVLLIDDDHALKLTTARYFTPSGRSIQAEGIHPDELLADGDADEIVLARALEVLKRG